MIVIIFFCNLIWLGTNKKLSVYVKWIKKNAFGKFIIIIIFLYPPLLFEINWHRLSGQRRATYLPTRTRALNAQTQNYVGIINLMIHKRYRFIQVGYRVTSLGLYKIYIYTEKRGKNDGPRQ